MAYSVAEFAAAIKTKYPEYADVDDLELAKAIVTKYPEYKEDVAFGVAPATPALPQPWAKQPTPIEQTLVARTPAPGATLAQGVPGQAKLPVEPQAPVQIPMTPQAPVAPKPTQTVSFGEEEAAPVQGTNYENVKPTATAVLPAFSAGVGQQLAMHLQSAATDMLAHKEKVQFQLPNRREAYTKKIKEQEAGSTLGAYLQSVADILSQESNIKSVEDAQKWLDPANPLLKDPRYADRTAAASLVVSANMAPMTMEAVAASVAGGGVGGAVTGGIGAIPAGLAASFAVMADTEKGNFIQSARQAGIEDPKVLDEMGDKYKLISGALETGGQELITSTAKAALKGKNPAAAAVFAAFRKGSAGAITKAIGTEVLKTFGQAAGEGVTEGLQGGAQNWYTSLAFAKEAELHPERKADIEAKAAAWARDKPSVMQQALIGFFGSLPMAGGGGALGATQSAVAGVKARTPAATAAAPTAPAAKAPASPVVPAPAPTAPMTPEAPAAPAAAPEAAPESPETVEPTTAAIEQEQPLTPEQATEVMSEVDEDAEVKKPQAVTKEALASLSPEKAKRLADTPEYRQAAVVSVAKEHGVDIGEIDFDTALPDRNYIRGAINRALAKPEENLVFFFDLDKTKPQNEIYGHEAVDRVFEALGGYIRKNFAGMEYGRQGGEEFAVVLKPSEIGKVQAFMDEVSGNLSIYGEPVTISGGVAAGRTEDGKMRAATMAEEAKDAGRNQITVDTGVTTPYTIQGKDRGEKPYVNAYAFRAAAEALQELANQKGVDPAVKAQREAQSKELRGEYERHLETVKNRTAGREALAPEHWALLGRAVPSKAGVGAGAKAPTAAAKPAEVVPAKEAPNVTRSAGSQVGAGRTERGTAAGEVSEPGPQQQERGRDVGAEPSGGTTEAEPRRSAAKDRVARVLEGIPPKVADKYRPALEAAVKSGSESDVAKVVARIKRDPRTKARSVSEADNGQGRERDAVAVREKAAEDIATIAGAVARGEGVSPERLGIRLAESPADEDALAAESIAAEFGNTVAWFSVDVDGLESFKDVYGIHYPKLPHTIFLNVNRNTRGSLGTVAHELMHAMRVNHPDLYKTFADVAGANLTETGVERVAEQEPKNVEGKLEETYAEFSEAMVTDAKFWQRLWERSPEAFRAAMAELGKIVTRLLGMPNAKEQAWFKDVSKVRDTLADVMAEFRRRSDMEEGNIRIDGNSGYMDLSVPPTDAQRQMLADLVKRQSGKVELEMQDRARDYAKFYHEYTAASPEQVLADIDAFFAGGKQAQSLAQQYHEAGDVRYSRREKPALEDFGAKIGGARKDYYSDYAERLELASTADVAEVPLSQSWPEPDYEKMLSEGRDPWVVGFARAAREEVPTKPQKPWKARMWADNVRTVRDMTIRLLSGVYSADRVRELTAGGPLRGMVGRAELYQIFGHGKSLKGISLADHHYSFYHGEKNVTKWVVERQGKATIFGNMPGELGVGDTKEEAIEQFRQRYDALGEKVAPEKKQTKFMVYQRRDTKKYYIGKKVTGGYLDMKEFESAREALDYRKGYQTELEDQLERMRQVPNERRLFNRDRVGEDHRGGKPVTAEMFSETFGFRGVEFGNWVNSTERQDNLDRAYDSLFDLASILNVPPRALSLGGKLGLGFGSRGTGGKNPASAHYEPDRIVINLTKKNGPGSLAHEWWHAFDNYVSRQRGRPLAYMVDNPRQLRNPRDGTTDHSDGTRPELIEAFTGVARALDQTGMTERARNLDMRRSKGYWGMPIEMTARAFESYVLDKLDSAGATNDYLVNVATSPEYAVALAETLLLTDANTQADVYPYLLKDEIPAVRAAFDAMWQTIKTREDGGATVMYSRREKGEPAPVFYSPALRAAESLKQEKGTGEQMLAMLKKTPGVKQAELDWMGVDQEFAGKASVTKLEMADFIRKNQVTIEETKKGEKGNYRWDDDEETRFLWVDGEQFAKVYPKGGDYSVYFYGDDSTVNGFSNIAEAEEFAEKESPIELAAKNYEAETKFATYVLPGGANYRELLLRMPAIPANTDGWTAKESEGDPASGPIWEVRDANQRWVIGVPRESKPTPAEAIRYAGIAYRSGLNNYKGSHWIELNVFAHTRVDDRVGPNGERVLFVEEIQSDWAREARDRGVNDGRTETVYYLEYIDGRRINVAHQTREEAERAIERLGGAQVRQDLTIREVREVVNSGVPNQPFLKNWAEVVLKRLVRMAAEEGYDRLAFINGQQTADRYDLSKRLVSIGYELNEDGTYLIEAYGKHGEIVWSEKRSTEEAIKAALGKDIAAKVVAGEGHQTGSKNYLEGVDLKIGGEWAVNLYDKQVPSFLDKFGKRFGAKTGTTDVVMVPNTGKEESIVFPTPEMAQQYRRDKRLVSPQLSLPITDAMRESVLTEGVPMFSKRKPADLTGQELDRAAALEEAAAQHAVAAAMQTEVNRLRFKLRSIPEERLAERAQLQLEINDYSDVRREIVVNAIYQYAKSIGLRGEPYNALDTMLKNAKTKNDLEKAVESIDDRWAKAVQKKLYKKALSTVENAYRYLKGIEAGKVSTTDAVKNAALQDYLDSLAGADENAQAQATRMLAYYNQYGKEKRTNTEQDVSLMGEDTLRWLEHPNEAVPGSVTSVLKRLFRQNLKEMSSEELVKVTQNIRDIRAEGRTRRQAQTAQRALELDEMSAHIANDIVAAGKQVPGTRLEKLIDDGRYKSDSEKRMRALLESLEEFGYSALDAERIVEGMVGFNPNSQAKKALWTPLWRASVAEMRGMGEAERKFKEIFGKFNMGKARTEQAFEVELVDPKADDKRTINLTVEEMMFVYANSQNPSNRSHLLGTGFSEDAIQKVSEALPREYRESVDKLIDWYDNVQYPRISEQFEREHQVAMPKEHRYFPLMALDTDRGESQVVVDMMARMGARQTGISKGMTKSRIGAATPFNKMSFFDVVLSNIKAVEHYVAFAEPVRDVQRVLRHPEVRNAIEARSKVAYGQLDRWLKTMAYGKLTPAQGNEKILNVLRNNYAAYVLGYKLSSIMMQTGSLPKGLGFVNKARFMGSLGKALTNLPGLLESVDKLSPMMASRTKSFERDIAEAFDQQWAKDMLGTASAMNKIREAGMWTMGAYDKLIAATLWDAKYREVLAKNPGDSAAAVDAADEMVRKTQSGGGLIVMPEWHRGSIFARMLSQFKSDPSKTVSLLYEMAGKMQQQGVAATSLQAFWVLVAPALVAYLIKNGFANWPWEEPEDIGRELANNVAGGIPYVGAAVEAAGNALMDEVARRRGVIPNSQWEQFAGDTNIPALQGVGTMSEALAKGKLGLFLEAVGGIAGIPGGSQVKRVITGIKKTAEGKASWRSFVFGPAGDKKNTVEASMQKRLESNNRVKNAEFLKWWSSRTPQQRAAFAGDDPAVASVVTKRVGKLVHGVRDTERRAQKAIRIAANDPKNTEKADAAKKAQQRLDELQGALGGLIVEANMFTEEVNK